MDGDDVGRDESDSESSKYCEREKSKEERDTEGGEDRVMMQE